MRGLPIIIAASVLCLTTTAHARMPIFIELDGVKGETEKKRPKPQSAPEQTPEQGIAAPTARQRGGVRVAAGDVTGDGRAESALLLPAVQKVRATDNGADPVPATSTQGPYKRPAPALGEQAPRDLAAPRPAPQPLLVPAVQKPGVGSRRVAPRPQNPPPPPPK